jgi:hypothetical protein
VSRGLLLIRATDFTHHHDGPGFGVPLERLEAVDEGRAIDGIAADADAGGLADAGLGELVDELVGERDTTPTGPGRTIDPGMIPTFDFPGEISPGQFGPRRRTPFSITNG